MPYSKYVRKVGPYDVKLLEFLELALSLGRLTIIDYNYDCFREEKKNNFRLSLITLDSKGLI
jgi:hypothetical protein